MVEVLGGLESVVPDIFGEEMKICSLREGVDSVLRSSLLRHRLATVLQPPWVPAFTSRGWEVAEVPGRLLGMINIARLNGIKMMEEEPCLADAACFNCQRACRSHSAQKFDMRRFFKSHRPLTTKTGA